MTSIHSRDSTRDKINSYSIPMRCHFAWILLQPWMNLLSISSEQQHFLCISFVRLCFSEQKILLWKFDRHRISFSRHFSPIYFTFLHLPLFDVKLTQITLDENGKTHTTNEITSPCKSFLWTIDWIALHSAKHSLQCGRWRDESPSWQTTSISFAIAITRQKVEWTLDIEHQSEHKHIHVRAGTLPEVWSSEFQMANAKLIKSNSVHNGELCQTNTMTWAKNESKSFSIASSQSPERAKKKWRKPRTKKCIHKIDMECHVDVGVEVHKAMSFCSHRKLFSLWYNFFFLCSTRPRH